MDRRTRCVVVFALLMGACASANTAPATSSVLTTASASSLPTTADPAETQPAPTVVSATTGSSNSTSTTAAPTTTIDPMAPAREAFLVMEIEWETSSDIARNTHGDGNMVLWEDQPDWCADQAIVDASWASDVAGYAWPPELAASADALVVALTVRSGVFEECSRMPGTWDGQMPIGDRIDAAYVGLNTARDDLCLGLGLPRIE
ncbi:MAG: hypothetical protein QY307_04250 [Acidimicrobiia bacterium]|nr:MAG: hypothetical protein QY307_04250 [Acidimicrobiia bacterium]